MTMNGKEPSLGLYYKTLYVSNCCNKLECFPLPYPSVIFAGKAGAYEGGALTQLYPNISRLWWKCMEVANTLAYYETATITDVKCFNVQAPSG